MNDREVPQLTPQVTSPSQHCYIHIAFKLHTFIKIITYSDNVILDAATDKNENGTILHLSYQLVISDHRGLQLYYYSNVVAVFVLLLGRFFWIL